MSNKLLSAILMFLCTVTSGVLIGLATKETLYGAGVSLFVYAIYFAIVRAIYEARS